MSRARIIMTTGDRYGSLVIVSAAGLDDRKNSVWECLCDCGKARIARGSELRRGITTSCGCLKIKHQAQAITKHGHSRDPLNAVWRAMIARTSSPKVDSYKFYGARGISVCAEWKSSFEAFRSWALENGYQLGLSIDRIDNDGNYEPSNCRWITAKEQASNRRVRKDSRSRKDTEMKTFKKVCAQGEITTDIVEKIPDGATLRKVAPIGGKLVISHSESGHHHYIPACDAELLERTDSVPAGMQIFYSIVKNPTALRQDAAAPHDEISLGADIIYRHRISREFDPFAEQARRVAD